eukprot:scaffold11940_cov106-Isochrysis_galbana.AAC.11
MARSCVVRTSASSDEASVCGFCDLKGNCSGSPWAALAGGWFKSCVHYNSLRLGLENLGENVEPSYVRVHLDSLRADYG